MSMIDTWFEPKTRSYYFADKAHAESFRQRVKSLRRIQGRITCRKTLAGRMMGKVYYRDRRHIDGYTVRIRAWSLADEMDIARDAKQENAISAPLET